MKDKENVKHQIILTLLEARTPITVSELAKLTSISGKSVRNYLKELQYELKDKNITLIKKPHVGVFFDITDEERKKLKSEIMNESLDKLDYSSEYRKKYILKTLFKNKYTYTIQLLADDLYCSKSTIVNDLVFVEKWLQNKELILKRKQNQGIWIEGDEKKYRRAMMDLFHEIKSEHNCEYNCDIEELDYRISSMNFKRIKQFFPRIDLYKIQKIIQETEEMLGYYFTDQAFINLVTHIAITIERVKSNKNIEMSRNNYGNIKKESEFEAAQWMLKRLSEEFKLSFPEEEIGYLLVHIMGAKTQQYKNTSNLSLVIESENQENVNIAKEIISLIGQVLSVDLSKDEVLLTSLVLHLKPTIFRLKHGLKLRNPIVNRIKEEYTSIFGATWACSTIFEKKFGVLVNEDEIGYIAMHIAAAVERLNNKIKTIVVCSSGIGTSQLVTTRICRKINEIEIIGTLSLKSLNEDLINEADLILCTIPNVTNIPKMVYISVLVDENDILQIKKYINKFCKNRYKHKNQVTSNKCKSLNIIDEDLCFMDCHRNDFTEIINYYGKIMLEKGYVKEGFCENILKREKKGSTSIGNGIAIPHASQEFVVKSKICIVKLSKSIIWQNNRLNLIIILALKFTDIDATKGFFKNFYSLLDDKELIKKINTTNNKSEIVKIFNNGGMNNV